MKVENAIKRLIKKYNWYTNYNMSWDYGKIFQKRNYDKERDIFYVILEVETTINGIVVNTPIYMVQYPQITYEELKLFKIISDWNKKMFDDN